jgi:hypothetical protein
VAEWRARQHEAAAAAATAAKALADGGQPAPSAAPALAPAAVARGEQQQQLQQQEAQPPSSLGLPSLSEQELDTIVADINRVHFTARWAGHGGAAAAGELFHPRVRAQILVTLIKQLPREWQLYVVEKIESNLHQEQTAVALA